MRKSVNAVRIVEVSPRDGLQNETVVVPTDAKVALVRGLVGAGAREIEIGSFVSPKWVPQMSDTVDVVAATKDLAGLQGIVLVPNLRGLARIIHRRFWSRGFCARKRFHICGGKRVCCAGFPALAFEFAGFSFGVTGRCARDCYGA